MINKPENSYAYSKLFRWKKDSSEKNYSDFWSIFDVLSDGVNKNYILLFLNAEKSQ